jgi:hypothetical protein
VHLRCAGRGAPPEVRLEPALVDFGDVALGSRAVRTVTIASQAPHPVQWQVASPDGAFVAEPAHGVLGARSTATVSVSFAPGVAINFHKRMFVLLRDREPLRFDAIGTGFDDTHRPLPFPPASVQEAKPWNPSSFAEYSMTGTGVFSWSPPRVCVYASNGGGAQTMMQRPSSDCSRPGPCWTAQA